MEPIRRISGLRRGPDAVGPAVRLAAVTREDREQRDPHEERAPRPRRTPSRPSPVTAPPGVHVEDDGRPHVDIEA